MGTRGSDVTRVGRRPMRSAAGIEAHSGGSEARSWRQDTWLHTHRSRPSVSMSLNALLRRWTRARAHARSEAECRSAGPRFEVLACSRAADRHVVTMYAKA
eukprot:1235448-Pleurochrysis_carterae.AAC.1